MAVRPLLATVALLGATVAFAAPPVSAADQPIQPGGYMSSGGAACTLSFVYDGTGTKAGKVYLGTAAHCVSSVGADVAIQSGEVFGDVAYLGNANVTVADFALIEVRPAFVSRVLPWVKGWPAYPTGWTTPAETAVGDLIQNSGYGTGFHTNNVTREQRVAILTGDDAERWQAVGAISFGDSGGPLVHIRTGKALGIESRVCLGACTDEGPTVQGILAKAAAAGFTMNLRTAP